MENNNLQNIMKKNSMQSAADIAMFEAKLNKLIHEDEDIRTFFYAYLNTSHERRKTTKEILKELGKLL